MSWKCVILWVCRWLLRLKALLHTEQTYGFSPVCTRRCVSSDDLDIQANPHTWQTRGPLEPLKGPELFSTRMSEINKTSVRLWKRWLHIFVPVQEISYLGQNILFVDSQIFFFRFRVGGRKKNEKSFFSFFFRAFFLFNISRKNSKSSKVNQQSTLNLKYFIIYLKIWTGQSLLTVSR